jgi:hypothetical protein
MKKFNKFLVGISITYALLFSLRIVVISTPLNLAEQIGAIAMLFEYTMLKSKRVDNDKSE